MRYLPLSDSDRGEMLAAIGASSIDDLFVDVPPEARLDGLIEDLPLHASELSVERQMTAMARKNMVAGEVPFFLGCGAYRHHVPASVDHIIQRGEFLTSYTPYQPEIAQGTLQMLFEFQTQVARLYGCDIANASMYDGSTACWEAILMAGRITRREKAILSSGLHPHYVNVATTMARFTGDTLDTAAPDLVAETDSERLIAAIDDETSAVVVQYPDILGRITDLAPIADAAHSKGALLIAVVTEPVALGLIRSPGEMGADIVVGEGQSIGVGLQFGGPYVGLFACAEKFVRQMPGRQARLRSDALHPRAAHPPRKGDQQHLHQLGALRAGLHRASDLARREGPSPARIPESRARVRSRRAAGGNPGRRTDQRQLLQRIHGQAAGRGAARGACDGRARGAWRCLAGPALSWYRDA
jgi:glycine dehydrogenase subunit 1